MSYLGRIEDVAMENNYFRKVLFTGKKSQLVVMDIKPGEDIGEETHAHVEQVLYFFVGEGKSVLDGKERKLKAGDVLIVTPGTKHNVINTGAGSLKVATVYVPPNHIDGTVHKTKADAVADVKDEAFGEQVQ